MDDLSLLRERVGLPVREPLRLDAYQNFAICADKTKLAGKERLNFLLLGLFGEVGSLLSELKKKQRDKNAYFAYDQSAQEETGDALWYLTNVASHLDISLAELAAGVTADGRSVCSTNPNIQRFVDLERQDDLVREPASSDHVERSLLRLAARAGRLVHRANAPDMEVVASELRVDLAHVFAALVSSAGDAHISLERAALANMDKSYGRWPKTKAMGPLFDDGLDTDEKLPRHLEVTFRERTINEKKYVFQSVHGINLGDRLTDNSAAEDDYRFHDVFHLAYAAILGWSPVLRALLKVKRKSQPSIDEEQDGARAIIAEEGISNWIFSHGLRHRSFVDVDSLDFSLLKTIREMVKGYEVEVRPLWMWEHAILEGFRMFREVRHHKGGVVTIDLNERKITYKRP
jgi:NTP pyrophosphatase (non-canonical NTP hydrolase)